MFIPFCNSLIKNLELVHINICKIFPFYKTHRWASFCIFNWQLVERRHLGLTFCFPFTSKLYTFMNEWVGMTSSHNEYIHYCISLLRFTHLFVLSFVSCCWIWFSFCQFCSVPMNAVQFYEAGINSAEERHVSTWIIIDE